MPNDEIVWNELEELAANAVGSWREAERRAEVDPYAQRRDACGRPAAAVGLCGAPPGVYHAEICGRGLVATHLSVDDAKAWCDAHLLRLGYTLYDTTTETPCQTKK